MPAEATRALGDVIRPFDGLTGLEVGRTWRVRLLNPLAGMIPDWGARLMGNQSIVVRVTGKEQVPYRDEMVEAYVVEAEKIRAWMTADGRLIRQEYEVPLIGRLVLIDEPFDPRLRSRVLAEARLKMYE